MGIILYEMTYGQPPWICEHHIELIKKMNSIPITYPEKQVDPTVLDFIKKTLVMDQELRIGWSELYQHPLICHNKKNPLRSPVSKRFIEDSISLSDMQGLQSQ